MALAVEIVATSFFFVKNGMYAYNSNICITMDTFFLVT